MIKKMLAVSTKHISKKTCEWLNEQGKINATSHETQKMADIHCASHAYGHIVYCHDDGTEDYPEDLVKVLDFARLTHDCNYVDFDNAGEEWDELEEFDW